jgi:ankyrin repeat protein
MWISSFRLSDLTGSQTIIWTVTDSFIWAVKRGDLLELRNALRSETNLNAVDSQGWTPLFHAAYQGNPTTLELLIEAGADVNHGVETGFTALFAAVLGGHVEAVRVLLNAGAKIAPVQGIALRAHCVGTNSKHRDAILAMLDNA